MADKHMGKTAEEWHKEHEEFVRAVYENQVRHHQEFKHRFGIMDPDGKVIHESDNIEYVNEAIQFYDSDHIIVTWKMNERKPVTFVTEEDMEWSS